MDFKKTLKELNIFSQCAKYGLPLWQCPQFLFLVMGIFIIVVTLVTYAIGTEFINDPALVALIILILTVVLLIIAFIITKSFERLAEASRMKSEFINIISHQLRSPLTNLKWALDFLTSKNIEDIKEKKEGYYDILKDNAARMGELIDNLLIVSRIEDKKVLSNKEEVSLEDIIRKLIQFYQPFALASNIEIIFNPEENLPKAFVDPFQIKLLIDNFLSNAIRYGRGKGKVEINLLKKDSNFYFEIKDNGIGISKADKKYIFQKFFRAKNAFKNQTRGSGLGLYIAKYVAESSRGGIGFESEEGKGSTFWFTLPIN